MGLDFLCIIFRAERAFGVDFRARLPRENPIVLNTPRHVVNCLKGWLPLGYAEGCLTSRTYYEVRDALAHINPAWVDVSPRTRLDELVHKKAWRPLWAQVRSYGEGRWPRKVNWPAGWFTEGLDKSATVGELARFLAMESAEARPKPGEAWTWEQIALTFRKVIWEVQGLLRFSLNDDFTRDMGLE